MATFPGLFQPIGVQPRDEYLAQKQAMQQQLQYGQTRNALADGQLQIQQNALAQQPDMEKRDRLQKGLAVVAQYNDPQTWQAFLQHASKLGATPAPTPQEFAIANGLQWQAPPSYSVKDLGNGVMGVVDQTGALKGSPKFPEEKGPGTLYRVGKDGRYVTADQAIGQPGYEPPRVGDSKPGYGAPQDGINPATGQPEKFVVDDMGRVRWLGVGSNPPASASKVTDVERTAAGFLDRMSKAEPQIGDFQPSVKDYVGFSRILNGGATSASLGNALMSERGQKYYQAASDWVRAKLRKESGAVIGPQEMEQEIRTYFPMPGDSKAVIAQKAKARQTAMSAMQTNAGAAVGGGAGRRVKVDAEGNVIGN